MYTNRNQCVYIFLLLCYNQIMKNLLDKNIILLKEKVKELFLYETSGHDIEHLENVLNYALQIQKDEGGDMDIIIYSAYLHDIHRLMANKTNGKYVTPKESLPIVYNILLDLKVDNDKIEKILKCIENHEKKGTKKTFDLETQILQDADVLDAIGKRGLERTLKYCKKYQIPLTNFNFELDCKEYIPDINPISTCHYVYRTMIPHAKNLNTKMGQKMANDSIEELYKFIEDQGYKLRRKKEEI